MYEVMVPAASKRQRRIGHALKPAAEKDFSRNGLVRTLIIPFQNNTFGRPLSVEDFYWWDPGFLQNQIQKYCSENDVENLALVYQHLVNMFTSADDRSRLQGESLFHAKMDMCQESAERVSIIVYESGRSDFTLSATVQKEEPENKLGIWNEILPGTDNAAPFEILTSTTDPRFRLCTN